MKELEINSNFKKLEQHVIKLLNKVRLGFGKDINNYALFLAYLVNQDEYQFVIEKVDNSLQLLLNEPHKYWFDDNNYDKSDQYTEIKRQIIKYIILQQLELFLLNNNGIVKKSDEFKKFIKNKKESINSDLSANNSIEIFQQNMDFSDTRDTSYSIENIKEKISYSFGAIGGILGGTASLIKTLEWLNSFVEDGHEIDYFEFRERKKAYSLLMTVATITSGLITYKIANVAMAYIGSKDNRNRPKFTIYDFIEACAAIPVLSMLLPTKTNINLIWTQNSSLFDSENNQSVLLRTYIHKELASLKEDMALQDFIKLLVCMLSVDKVPFIKEMENGTYYSLPVSIFNNPEENWPIRYKEANGLLREYLKVAIIEYVNEELNNLKDSNINKETLKIYLQKQTQTIEKKIQTINQSEFSIKDDSDIVQFLAKIILTATTSTALLMTIVIWRAKSMRQTWLDEGIDPVNADEWRKLMEAGKTVLIALPVTACGGVGTFFAADKLAKIYKSCQAWAKSKENQIPISDFFDSVIGADPSLQQIFPPATNTLLPKPKKQ